MGEGPESGFPKILIQRRVVRLRTAAGSDNLKREAKEAQMACGAHWGSFLLFLLPNVGADPTPHNSPL